MPSISFCARLLDQSPFAVHTRGVVVVITGPIASGKCTLGEELARELELDDVHAEVIDLDRAHDRLTADGSMADDSIWSVARHEAATVTNAFLSPMDGEPVPSQSCRVSFAVMRLVVSGT